MVNKNRKTVLLYIIPAAFRIWFGQMLGVYFLSTEGYDDAMMVSYASFSDYFLLMDQRNVMLKELGMPVVYRIVNLLGIPYTIVLSLLWILNGLLAAKLVFRLTSERKISFLPYRFEYGIQKTYVKS